MNTCWYQKPQKSQENLKLKGSLVTYMCDTSVIYNSGYPELNFTCSEKNGVYTCVCAFVWRPNDSLW